MAAVAEHVGVDPGRVGQLDVKDFVARQLGDGARVVAQRQGVKAVEDQAQVRVVGPLHRRTAAPATGYGRAHCRC